MKKARISSYTRKDGVFVAEHHDKRQAARPDAPGNKPVAKQQNPAQQVRSALYDNDASALGSHKVGDKVAVAGSNKTGTVKGARGGKVVVEHAGSYTESYDHSALSAAAKPAARAKGGGAPTAQKPADAAAEDVRDDENPKFALQSLGSEHVAAAASGKHDLNKQAKVELANRGLDAHGRWIGFKGAEAVHGLSLSDMQAGQASDQNQVAGHFQTLHPKVLSAVASGKFDMNAHAKREAASRGIDQNGKWVGFDKAKAIHAEKPEAPIAKAIPLAFRLP